jgi:AraC-like DNA-binding protein
MADHLTTLAAGYEAVSRVLKNYQIDSAQVFDAAGVDPRLFDDPDNRLPLAAIKALWHQCERLTNNPCFAFEAGMAIVPANLHALGFAWLASRNLREALDRLARYQRLLSTALMVRVDQADDELHLVIEAVPHWPQQALDVSTTGIVALCRDITYEEFKPLRIEMTRAEPRCAKQLARFFGCPVTYGVARTCIAFRRDQAEKFLPRQNPALARASDDVALKYIAQMDREDVLSRAKVSLIDMLSNGEPTRTALAHRLHMSERTLARRLNDRAVSFRALLDNVRKELALAYIDQARYAVTDIAYLLGFSDQSNFARSFRRWTGSTPSKYRSAKKRSGTPDNGTRGD